MRSHGRKANANRIKSIKERLDRLSIEKNKIDQKSEKLVQELDYLITIEKDANSKGILYSDIPLENKLSILESDNMVAKYYKRLKEKAQDDLEGLRGMQYFSSILLEKQDNVGIWKEIDYIEMTDYILDFIFDFIFICDIEHSIRSLKTLRVSDSITDCHNELVLESSTYYYDNQNVLKIPVNPENYNILKDFNHPLNIIFNRNLKMVDIYVKNRELCSKTFTLNDKSRSLIKKNKIEEIKVDEKADNLVEEIRLSLRQRDIKTYDDVTFRLKKYLETGVVIAS